MMETVLSTLYIILQVKGNRVLPGFLLLKNVERYVIIKRKEVNTRCVIVSFY